MSNTIMQEAQILLSFLPVKLSKLLWTVKWFSQRINIFAPNEVNNRSLTPSCYSLDSEFRFTNGRDHTTKLVSAVQLLILLAWRDHYEMGWHSGLQESGLMLCWSHPSNSFHCTPLLHSCHILIQRLDIVCKNSLRSIKMYVCIISLELQDTGDQRS